jgi:acyl dehydratase
MGCDIACCAIDPCSIDCYDPAHRVLGMRLVANLLYQRAVLASLAETALRSLLRTQNGRGAARRSELPGAELHRELPSPAASLIRDYTSHVGGNAELATGTIPPHFFPQFSLPLAAETLRGLPYPIHRIVNAGCRLDVHGPLALGERLHVRARLESIDDDGRRAVLRQRIVIGQRPAEEAVVAHVHAVVPLARRTDAERGNRAEPARVPADAERLEALDLKADAGLEFALLTGDFNPVHWIRPYARALGYRGAILHGFASMARVYEALARSRSDDASGRIRMLDVRFVRPLVLPASVGVYRRGDAVYVGLPGQPAYVTGTYTAGGMGDGRKAIPS